jgi:tetratricopeptide (TPR) repeat protein
VKNLHLAGAQLAPSYKPGLLPMKYSLLALLLALAASLAAQPANRRLDSLELVLARHTRRDTNRVKTLNELVWEHRSANPARSLTLAAEALQLGKLQHFRAGQAKTYALLGIIHQYAGRLDAARSAFDHALQLRRQLGDSVGVAGMVNNIGSIDLDQGDYEAAVRAFV